MCNSNVDTKASPVMSPATAPVKAEKADKKVSKKRKRDAELATLPTDSPKKTKTKKSKKEKKEKDTDAQPSKKAKTNSGDAVVPAEKEEKVEEAKAEENGVLTREQYYEKHDIKFWDGDVERPYQSFADIESYINKPMQRSFEKAGFKAPSIIQSVCWPAAFSGRDLIAIAKTGSGKTLGFLIPAFRLILKSMPTDPRQPRIMHGQPPLALVIAPTRELAVQINDESVKFGNASRIVSTNVFGGLPSGKQIRELRRGSHIVIATPGRLSDLLELDNPPVTNLNSVQYAVLDEADQMLDMGFEPVITALMGKLPEVHQTLMFTATWPKAIQRIAYKFLKNPLHIQVGGDGLKANSSIAQTFMLVPEHEKEAALVKELAKLEDTKESILVFCNRKHACDGLARSCKRGGMKALAIHGDMDQASRMWALKEFKDGKVRIIVATDVAARGLDIDGVGMVINYDFPSSGCDIWVHRVGRTGRAGRTGKAITFFDQWGVERKHADDLLELLKNSGTEIPEWLPPLGRKSRGENQWKDAKKGWFKGKQGGGGGGWGGGGRW